MKVKKHHYLALLALLGAESCQTTEKTPPPTQLPNIIYVLADDMGYGDVQALNPASRIETPHLNQMAAEGMVFTDAHTSSAVSSPTRYGILTGRYNWRSPLKHGVLWSESKALIDTNRTTVASLLKEHGYHTAYIGKWHLGWNWAYKPDSSIDFSRPVTQSPNALGFDYAYGHIASLDIPPYVYVENSMPTAIPIKTTENKDYQGFWRKGLTAPDFVHDSVTQHFFKRGISYIENRATQNKPFFLYLPLPSPHTPILPAPHWQGKSNLNPYADFVMMIDYYMGQVLAAVKKAGIEENTLIVFTSDNGCSPRANFEALRAKGHDPSANFRGHKADIYEGGHRVPFIVKWPAKIKPGKRSEKTICTTDWLATCAQIVGYPLKDNEGEDSFSLCPLWDNDSTTRYARQSTVHHSINGSFALRKGSMKLIFCPGSGGWSFPTPSDCDTLDLPPAQLYNLANDPQEKQNLYDSLPQTVTQLTAEMLEILDNGRSTPGSAQPNDPPMWGKKPQGEEKIRNLK